MDTYSTWQHFLEVRLGICVERWVQKKKAKINQPTPQNGDVDHLKGLSESHPLPEFFCVIVDKRVCADTV